MLTGYIIHDVVPFVKSFSYYFYRQVWGRKKLAKRSQVSLRSIQMYEQRNKDINKASAETVLRLSRVLGCTMEDLLEK